MHCLVIEKASAHEIQGEINNNAELFTGHDLAVDDGSPDNRARPEKQGPLSFANGSHKTRNAPAIARSPI